ncbi:ERCC4 domain-containing protein [Thermogladius sp. 4427co]|uniref:ERCC4 domain-containing protein n=1 Tax=Thermogladius sp. 4427co TaxID=3450718 RepID=UPI003F796F84
MFLGVVLLTPVDVIIDSREDSKHPEFRKSLSMRGLRTAVQALPAGDFLLLAPPEKQSILVERKTVDDLANSIRDNRIWDQSKLLKEAAEKDGYQPLIIVEGWLGVLEKYREWRIQSVLRVLDTIILDYKIPVLNTPNAEATIEWIVAKAKSLGETRDKRVLRLRVEKKPMDLNQRILYVVEGIAGPTLARRLLAYFKTIRNLANASISDLLKVEGIGEKRAQEIFAILNTPWKGD